MDVTITRNPGWNFISGRGHKICQNTTTVATFQLIDPMLIYNQSSSKLKFQWDMNFMEWAISKWAYRLQAHLYRSAQAANSRTPTTESSTSLFICVFYVVISQLLESDKAGQTVYWHLPHIGCERFIKTARLWCWKQALLMQDWDLKVGVRIWSIYSINNVHSEEGGGVKDGEISRLRALADDQCLGFIFAISEGGWVHFWLNLSSYTSLKRT